MDIQQIAGKIFTLYPFDPSQPPIFLREGIDNDIYLFKLGGGKAVLRISKRNIVDTIEFETKLLQHLFEHKAPVVQLLPNNNGGLWEVINGVCMVAFHFVTGTAVLVENNSKPDIQYAHLAGEALGKLHTAGLSFTYENPKRRTIFTEYERMLMRSNTISKLEGGQEFLDIINSYLNWARGQQNNTGIIHGVIHNDFIPSNILFDGFSVSDIVDFDWACRGPLIKDLGIALAEWSLPDGLEHHWEEMFMSFLEGYNKSAPQKIPPDNNLYRWICFSCLSDACTFFADLPTDSQIARVTQCRRYKKFIYFKKYL